MHIWRTILQHCTPSMDCSSKDDEESRYSWSVHCATAAGKAKYAYCQNPEPAAAPATAPVAVVAYLLI